MDGTLAALEMDESRELVDIVGRLAATEEAEDGFSSPVLLEDFVSGDDDLTLGMWNINGIC